MMPTTTSMSHMIPSHVLRVGQTVRMDAPQQDAARTLSRTGSRTGSSGHCEDEELDMSLENLNQLILELDPAFQPIPLTRSPTCRSPATDSFCSDDLDDVSRGVLVPRGCAPSSSPTATPSASPSIPIPTRCSPCCSPHGALVFSSSPASSLPPLGFSGSPASSLPPLVFSGSPASSLPPLPSGSAPRRIPSPKQDFSQGSLRLSCSNRNSTASLLSMSTCSDTSYILGSLLSLAGDDGDSPDSLPPGTPRSAKHLLDLPGKLPWGSGSPSGSQTDIPLLLINGAPEPDLDLDLHLPEPDLPDLHLPEPDLPSPGPRPDQTHGVPPSPRRCSGFQTSQPSMRFVMDTSKFWFRPHVSRSEAENLVKDENAGTFVIRDSTSYRGSFGLAMKVDLSPSNAAAPGPGESGSDAIRHFLIESSAKGVRIRGSSQEPYFGSLSALVYQHTVSAYGLPCKLLLHSQELGASDERANDRTASEDQTRTACNFVYLDAVATETLTGPCAVQRAVTALLEKVPGSFTPTVVNLKVSPKGVTLTDVNRKLFFRRHYPAHLLSYGGEDPDGRLWWRGSSFGAKTFGFVAKSAEAGSENVVHVFAEYDPLQPCSRVAPLIQAAAAARA
ncbi:tensin-4-like [Cololabis saira]|uniref:tensin-4-like n=1 Tax=Cololabis saira TaxID=129043 RepID=UPI002AD46962|nr:tensin-4-like [Cololabis saira]